MLKLKNERAELREDRETSMQVLSGIKRMRESGKQKRDNLAMINRHRHRH